MNVCGVVSKTADDLAELVEASFIVNMDSEGRAAARKNGLAFLKVIAGINVEVNLAFGYGADKRSYFLNSVAAVTVNVVDIDVGADKHVGIDEFGNVASVAVSVNIALESVTDKNCACGSEAGFIVNVPYGFEHRADEVSVSVVALFGVSVSNAGFIAADIDSKHVEASLSVLMNTETFEGTN